MLWYSGLLHYDYELVKADDETTLLDVCMNGYIMLLEFINLLWFSRIQLINHLYFKINHAKKDEQRIGIEYKFLF
jgi:hypothetical protein